MLGNQKIRFVSLLRGKHFPRLIITWVNIHQIPQHARLTWLGRYLPLKQSLSTLLRILCSINSYTPTPTCFFIFAFVSFTLSSWDTLSWTSLYVEVYSEIYDSVQLSPWVLPWFALPKISQDLLFICFFKDLIIAFSGLYLLGSIFYIPFCQTMKSLRIGQE